jgi:hypothetical protein
VIVDEDLCRQTPPLVRLVKCSVPAGVLQAALAGVDAFGDLQIA